jgi:hypothetical protein
MADQPTPLTEDDFRWLYSQGRSEDPQARAEVTGLVKKMTPTESKAYYEFQKAQTAPPSKDIKVLGVPVHVVGDSPRPDSNMVGTDSGAGVAPEDALMTGMAVRGVTRAVSGATGAAGKVLAGAKSVASQAAPAIKYEVARGTLVSMGVPEPLARMAAMAFSSYTPGKGEPASEAPVQAPKTPPPVPAGIGRPNTLSTKGLTEILTAENRAAHPGPAPDLAAVLGPKAEPANPAPVIGKIAPKVYNELAIWARRAQLTLTPEEEAAAAQLVAGGGVTPPGAVTAIKALRAGTALRSVPGFMTDEQVASEIANRVGNRSPKR